MKRLIGFLGLAFFIFSAGYFAQLEEGWIKSLGVCASVGAANVLGYIEGLTL